MKRWDVPTVALAVVAVLAATAQIAIAIRVAPETLPEKLVALAVTTPAIVLGVIVARRFPANPVGAVIGLIGTLPLVDLTLEVWGRSAGTATALPGAYIVAPLAESTWMLHYVGPILIALVFPTGRLLSPGWRWAVATLVVIPVGFALITMFAPPDLGFLALPFPLGLLGLLVAAVVAVVQRYRRGDEQQRRQLRWLTASALPLPVILVVCWFELVLFDSTNGVGIALALLVVALPVSVAVAMLRHELWGVDRVLAGTVRWTLIAAGVGAAFLTAVLLLGLIFGQTSPVAAAVATLLATLLARPLHRGIRTWVDARFQPRRAALIAAVRRFVTDVRDGRAEPEELAAVLAGAGGAGIRVVVDDGDARLETDETAEITAADLQRVDAEARLPLELARLRLDLRAALAQTEASRARLVAAADDERRRIQRDLHDGAQSNLVALGMRLRSLQRGGDAPKVEPQLAEAVELVQRTIADLRAMAQGVRPSSLDEGLEQALRAMVRSVPVPVDLDLESVVVAEPRATAAYYLAAEAVTNALKHAHAGRIGIELARDAGGVRLSVRDDGAGGSADAIGFGLSGARDRVEAAGGRLQVTSTAGAGTVIEAVFP
jgi:signal transduction histidine kinase